MGLSVLKWVWCVFWVIHVHPLSALTMQDEKEYVRFQRFGAQDGLSQSSVRKIIQDRKGYLWLATQDGLNRYDGYRFKIYRASRKNPEAISDNFITALYEDTDGVIWVGSYNGLNRYDPVTDGFEKRFHDEKDGGGLSHDTVTALVETRDKTLLVGTREGLNRLERDERFAQVPSVLPGDQAANWILALMQDELKRIWVGTQAGLFIMNAGDGVYQRYDGVQGSISAPILCLFEDKAGAVWVGTDGDGLYRIGKDAARSHYPFKPDDPKGLNSPIVTAILEDGNGRFWVGVNGGGLNVLDRGRGVFHHYTHDPANRETISGNYVHSLFEDRTGILWIGTNTNGFNKLDSHTFQFKHYRHIPGDPDSLSDNRMRGVMEDEDGVLWLGTEDGLNVFDRSKGAFKRYMHDPSDDATISSKRVWAVVQDAQSRIWAGTYGGGLNLLDGETDTFTHFRAENGALSSDRISSLVVRSEGGLWVATDGGGLNVFDPSTGRSMVYRHESSDALSLPHDRVLALMEDAAGVLWVGTLGGGLARFDSHSGNFTSWRHDPNRSGSLSNDQVMTLAADPKGLIWVGTHGGGLNRFDPLTGAFHAYHEEDGLPNGVIYGILQDWTGRLWMSTNAGLAVFNPKTEVFRGYTMGDGLQNDEFNRTSYYRTRGGQMIFGGINGFNLFFPDQIEDDPHAPQVMLTDFLLFNVPAQERDRRFKVPIGMMESITLNHRDTIVTFEFAALHFAVPEKNRYAYRLEGLDEEWVYAGANMRFATYTRIPAGSYQFRVKAANKNNVWNDEGASITVTMLPPPWKTWWAYSLYALAVIGVIAWFMHGQRRKLVMERRALEQEQKINRRLKQLDKLKNEFLANTSHELRTPLNGIIGIAESMKDGAVGPLSAAAGRNLSMIISSGKRLASLVNDILDYSKIQNRGLELYRTAVDIKALTDVVTTLLEPLIGRKDLHLINELPDDLPCVVGDENRLQQIMLNLMGNAIKFTESGSIRVSAEREGDLLWIKIIDTGIGIRHEQLSSIFESFSQGDASIERTYGGTGMGLTIARELVRLHGGSVEVDSRVGEGSTFRFSLPVTEHDPSYSFDDLEKAAQAEAAAESIESLYLPEPEAPARDTPIFTPDGRDPASFHLLVVDDDAVNRQVLVNHLENQGYRTATASDGEEALAQVLAEGADYHLVLLDIMMPRMSGYEVCRRIRQRFTIQELPIIFLTAKSQVVDLVEGFAQGANDYLTKPIEKRELLSRVKNHLDLLMLNRDLERKVSERTHELKEKNSDLDSKYRELETLEQIIKTINREIEFTAVISTLLRQGLVLFPAAENAVFLIRDGRGDSFRCAAAIGHHMSLFKDVSMRPDELEARFSNRMARIDDGVYLSGKPLAAPMEDGLPNPASMIAMTVPLDGQMAGLLMLDHGSSRDAFEQSDVKKLMRFREHAVSAVAKAKVIKDLVNSQSDLVDAAHMAGMAEIATNVLHHIGNTLNGARVAAQMIRENLREEQAGLALFERIMGLLREHRGNLGEFFGNDPRGLKLTDAFEQILDSFRAQSHALTRESSTLEEHIQSVVEELREQQKFSHGDRLVEPMNLNQVLEETLAMKSYLLKDKGADLRVQYGDLPLVRVEKSKIIRCILILLSNAWESIEAKGEGAKGLIHISTRVIDDEVTLIIIDNGVGIPAENLKFLFNYGYSTRPSNRGFGLHYCSNAMHEMKGDVFLESAGRGKGATARLVFPKTIWVDDHRVAED